jgi:tetratricopeptide (TPR) repeat protein
VAAYENERCGDEMRRVFILALSFFSLWLACREAIAVDIFEIRVKRLYRDAVALTEKGDYAAALKAYNKAIGWAKDKDIKQFLINARKELQDMRCRNGEADTQASLNETAVEPYDEKPAGGLNAEEAGAVSLSVRGKTASPEEEKTKLDAEKAEKIKAKAENLAALDKDAEELMAKGEYEKARGIYKKILQEKRSSGRE